MNETNSHNPVHNRVTTTVSHPFEEDGAVSLHKQEGEPLEKVADLNLLLTLLAPMGEVKRVVV